MLLSRYIPIIAPLALAGALAAKPAAPETAGSLRADSATFGFTLWAVIVILGLLMFMPVAVLGPIAEHLALRVERAHGRVRNRHVQGTSSKASCSRLVTMVLLGGVYNVLLVGHRRASCSRRRPKGASIRRADGTVVGSRLIAQKFTRPEYFQPRPSAVDYNAASTGGSNYGPSNPDHLKAVQERLDAIDGAGEGRGGAGAVGDGDGERRRDGSAHSAGGGELQAARVAAARKAPRRARARARSTAHTESPTFGFLGRARVNVLELNLALDEALGAPAPAVRQ